MLRSNDLSYDEECSSFQENPRLLERTVNLNGKLSEGIRKYFLCPVLPVRNFYCKEMVWCSPDYFFTKELISRFLTG